jgi:hypothetical protein
MITLILLSVTLSLWQGAETKSQPIISATNPAYLGCTTWTGHEWTTPAARSARTPILESPKGFRAYGEVRVVVKDGSCENTTKLYVASAAERSFRTVYSPSVSDGNGIRLVGWSPNGDKLLAEVTLWKYETDLGYGLALRNRNSLYSISKGTLSTLTGERARKRNQNKLANLPLIPKEPWPARSLDQDAGKQIEVFCYTFLLRFDPSALTDDFSLWQTGTDAGGTP